MKFRVFWDVLPCSQIDVSIVRTMSALMMEAARISETSIDIDLRTRSTSQKALNFNDHFI
jgi:hypothetical protein